MPIEWDDSELDIFSYLKRTLICDKLHCDCYHCAISVVMDPRNQKWLRHQMVILSSTRTRLMNFQSELFLRTNERQISLSMYELPSPPPQKKSTSPSPGFSVIMFPRNQKKTGAFSTCKLGFHILALLGGGGLLWGVLRMKFTVFYFLLKNFE